MTASRIEAALLASCRLDGEYVSPEPAIFVAYVDPVLDEYDPDTGERLDEEECSHVTDDDCDCPPRSIAEAVAAYVESRT